MGPDQWTKLADTSPASRAGWVARLGGGGAASLAVSGAIRRGRLVGEGGVYRLDSTGPVQLALGLGGEVVHVLG